MSFGQPPGGGNDWAPAPGAPSAFGPPPAQGQPPPGGYYQPPPPAGGMAIASLVLGIIAWTGCGVFMAIPGAILGKMELNAIERGESSPQGKTLAQIGFWLSVANLIMHGIMLLFVIAYFVVVFVFVIAAGASGSH